MARPSGSRGFWGGVVNALTPGTPYNRHSGQYNGTALRNGLIQAGISQINPIAGQLSGMYLQNANGMGAYNAGLDGLGGLMGQTNAGNQAWQQGNQNFDSSGIRAEFAPIQTMDFTNFDPNAPAPQSQPQALQGQAQPPTSLAGLAVGGPRRDTRSGSSAGSSVLAEGQAARDMVDGWQQSAWLNMKAPQFGQQYTRQA